MLRLLIFSTSILALSKVAFAQQVKPGEALNITISGFARFLVAAGDLRDKPNLDCYPDCSSFDFRNDTEVHFIITGRHNQTGIEYGGTVEFEADTNRTDNTDESWIFVRGGFGEFRFGDEDSVANTMKVGAYNVAVGTGGIDGTIVDVNTPITVDFGNEDATKIIYYSPIINGLQFGISYIPAGDSSGDTLAIRESFNEVENFVHSGLTYTGSLGPVGILSSLVGGANLPGGDDWVAYGGVALAYGPISIAGGIGTRTENNGKSGDEDRNFYNLGASLNIDRYAFSVNYGHAHLVGQSNFGSFSFDSDQRVDDLVFGAEVGIVPGLALSFEIAYYDIDPFFEDQFEGGDSGVVTVTRLAISF
jgi:hypothetical protein